MTWKSSISRLARLSRRKLLATTLLYAASMTVRSSAAAGKETDMLSRTTDMADLTSSITTNDGAQIFYRDWGAKSAQPIVFHHGWPLSSDDWENQMLFFLSKGYRVIAHDRRGHGRSSQAIDGQDMDHYAADVAALASHLDLRNAIHVGHSTGGGEATRYVARSRSRSCCQAGADRCGAAVDGEDKSQSGRPADRSVGRSAATARRKPIPVLSGIRERPFLWLTTDRALNRYRR